MTFATTHEILRALADGKKVRHVTWVSNDYIHVPNNGIETREGGNFHSSFGSPDKWELFSEPKPKVKWYRAVYRLPVGPHVSSILFKDADAARNYFCEDFVTLLPDPIELETE